MNKKIFIITLSVVVLLLIAIVVYFAREVRQKQQELADFEEFMNFEKEMLEQEFVNFSLEFANFPTTIHNDSLLRLLDEEKMRVQQLLEELRVTRATNHRRIRELERELATVREIMRSYIVQIDSLNRENERLVAENVAVRRQATVATQQVQTLTREREVLTETVARASQLDISHFSFTGLNNRNRATTRVGQMANLRFDYTIARNITAQPGMKTIFLRITRPDGEVLTRSPNNVFPFENSQIAYSARKEFEYDGEAMNDVIFWRVEEILQTGTHRADFFVDGNHIGRFTFEIGR
jgi:hypothetical protein